MGRIAIIGLKVMAWSSIALVLFAVGLEIQFNGTRPTQPRPATGEVYARNVHGHVAVELGGAAIHLGRPRALRVLVNLGI